MFKINDQVVINKNKKNISGRLIGIDAYSLENFESKKERWLSYTLVSKNPGVFKRYWITNWKKDGWVLWTACPRIKNMKNQQVIEARSGIAKIEFSGDQGVSTPTAALIIYELKTGEFYATERFSGSRVMFFHGKKINKPKSIE